MKKIILLTILVMVSLHAFAPVNRFIPVALNKPVNIYDRLMHAIAQIESSGNIYAYNALEEACGPFQIRPIRLADYNNRTGKSLKMNDCFDYDISVEIFMYYTRGRSFETIAREWNGSGAKTIEYWNKVKDYL